MTIAPIRTESDYDAVMARIDELWGSEPETSVGDELEALIDLAWVYRKSIITSTLLVHLKYLNIVLIRGG